MKKNIERFYKELWTLPPIGLLISNLILVSFFIALLILIFDPTKFIYLSILIIALFIQLTFIRFDDLMSTKRALGYILFYFVGVFISLVVYYITTLPFLSIAILTTFITLGSIVLKFTSSLNKFFRISCTFLISIPLLFFHSLIVSKHSYSVIDNLIRSYFILGITLMLSEIYLFIIRKVIISKYNVDLLEHLKGFLMTWLNKEPRYYQETLKRAHSEKKKFILNLLALRFNSGKILGFTSLPIHPGPIAKVGSSELPTRLMTTNPHFIAPFHGFTTHKYDLVNKEDSEKLVLDLENKLTELEGGIELKSTPIITTSTKNFEIKGFKIENTPIVIISSKFPDIIDDIDHELYEKVNKLAHAMGFNSIITIDAHNSYNTGLKQVINYNEEIYQGICVLLENLKNEPMRKTKASVEKIKLSDIKGLEGEVCPGEGYVISFIGDDFKNCLILIDSNNINFDFRKKLINKLKELGIKGEICSTDTHVMTGSILGHNGYIPFGTNKEKHEEIIQRILDAIDRSFKTAEEVEVTSYSFETPEFNILGKLIEAYEDGTNKFVKYGRIIPYFVFLMALLSSFIFYPLL